MNILINILHSDVVDILHTLFSIVAHPIFLATPFILVYILFKILSKRLKVVFIKILLFIMLFFGTLLFEWFFLFNWLHADLGEIQTRFFRYILVCFFIYYVITMAIFVPRSKKMFFKILSTVVISLIFAFFIIFYIEREEIIKVEGPFGSERRIDCVYSLKQTPKNNSNFMIAWDKKSHGIILKWRYVIFVGKKEKPEIKAVSEGKFQKLLKEQQRVKNIKEAKR